MHTTKEKILIGALIICYILAHIMCFNTLKGTYEYKIDSNRLDNCITVRCDVFEVECNPFRQYNPNNSSVKYYYNITLKGAFSNLSDKNFNDIDMIIKIYNGYSNVTLSVEVSDLKLEPYQSKEFSKTFTSDYSFYSISSMSIEATTNGQTFMMRDYSEFLIVSKKYYTLLVFYIILLIGFVVISGFYLRSRKLIINDTSNREDKYKLQFMYKILLGVFLILLGLLLIESLWFVESSIRIFLTVIGSIVVWLSMFPFLQCSTMRKKHNEETVELEKLKSIELLQVRIDNEKNKNEYNKIICEYCGSKNNIDDKVCGGCGHKI